MESLMKLNSGRNGRDKIFRAAQYALKLVNALQVKDWGCIAVCSSSPKLTGSLKPGNVLVFVQLIHRPMGQKISCTKTQTFPNLRLPISSEDKIKIQE